jgi:hypothetical protein
LVPMTVRSMARPTAAPWDLRMGPWTGMTRVQRTVQTMASLSGSPKVSRLAWQRALLTVPRLASQRVMRMAQRLGLQWGRLCLVLPLGPQSVLQRAHLSAWPTVPRSEVTLEMMSGRLLGRPMGWPSETQTDYRSVR